MSDDNEGIIVTYNHQGIRGLPHKKCGSFRFLRMITPALGDPFIIKLYQAFAMPFSFYQPQQEKYRQRLTEDMVAFIVDHLHDRLYPINPSLPAWSASSSRKSGWARDMRARAR